MSDPLAIFVTMNWERYAPLTGVAAVVLWIVGTFLIEKDDRPEGKDTAAFVAWVEKNDTAIIAGAFIFGLGVVLFVWMLGSLRSVLFAAEGGTGRLATIAFGSGIATAISMMFTYFPQAQAAFDVDDTSRRRRTRSCTWAMRSSAVSSCSQSR